MTTHTPGPWTVTIHSFPNGNQYADILEARTARYDTLHANAHLIAAAPDLLAALERLLGCCELNVDSLDPNTESAIDQAMAAYERAKGVTS